jgi:hypothetical protein
MKGQFSTSDSIRLASLLSREMDHVELREALARTYSALVLQLAVVAFLHTTVSGYRCK